MCVWEVTELSFSFTYNHRRTMKTRKERGSDTGKSSYEYVRVEDCILGEKNAKERLIEDRLFLYTFEKIISSFHWSKPQLQNQVSFYSFASLTF